MPKLANYMEDSGISSVAIVWVNNDFGKGGRDNAVKEFEARGIEVLADISTEVQQPDFAPEVLSAKDSEAQSLKEWLARPEAQHFRYEG